MTHVKIEVGGSTSVSNTDKADIQKAERQIHKGFLAPAADIYTKILKRDPKHTEALIGMSIISIQAGHHESARGFIDKALEHDPQCAEAYARLGYLCNLKGEHAKAIEHYHKALELDSKNASAWSFLGENYATTGEIELLEKIGRAFYEKDPNNELALHAMGSSLIVMKRHDEAVDVYLKATEIDPHFTHAHYNLGNAYYWLGHYAEAEKAYRTTLKLQPKMVEAKENLVITLVKLRKDDQAAALVPSLLRETKNPQRALDLLAHAYREAGNLKRAFETSQELLRRYPTTLYMENCLVDANSLKDDKLINQYYAMLLSKEDASLSGISLLYNVARGRNDWEVAEKLWPKIVSIIEDMSASGHTLRNFSNLNLISDPNASPELIKRAHIISADNFRENRPIDWKPDHRKAFTPSERIRIGILSGDFYSHVVSHFINGWVKYHDRSRFELYCYANVPEDRRDTLTETYQATAEQFIFVDKMPHRELAEKIQNDGIHILVDLTGYTAGSLLDMVVYKPAPIIMTWLGYPCTTGCEEVDYVIGDRWLYTPEHERMYVEKMLVLEDSFCFVGEYRKIDPIVEPPAFKKGYVTFGTLMNPYKINAGVVKAWTEIVKRVPNSRLMMNHPTLNPEESAYKHLVANFEKQGFPMGRLDITHERHLTNHHLYYYHEFDIALDTFPQTGGTTTFESLLMAVPVVTLVGQSFLSRLSYSIINNAGLDNAELLTAFTIEEYVEKTVNLATHLSLLNDLRAELVARIHSSNLFSPRKMTRQLEEGFVRAWEETFPEFPVSQLLNVELIEEEMRNKLRTVMVPINGHPISFLTFDSENDPFNYILQEQQAWFDPEYTFLTTLLSSGQSFMDCCDDAGLYTLPIAHHTQPDCQVRVCVRSAERRFLLQLTAPDQVTIDLYDPNVNPFEGMTSLDLLRVTSEYNDDDFGGLIARHIDQLSELAPIIFFTGKQGNEFDLTMLDALKNASFTIYRYVSGLDILVPFDAESDPDAFLVNLFACKGKMEAWLAEQNKLVLSSDKNASYIPEIMATPFLEWVKDKPYAQTFIPDWTTKWAQEADNFFEVYRVLLDAWAVSKDKEKLAPLRYAALKTAFTYIQPFLSATKDMSVLMTAIRILSDYGRREASVQLLVDLKMLFDSGDVNLEWPFIPVDSEWEEVDSEGRIAEWLFGSAIETLENRRAFSTFFVGEEQIEPYQLVLSMGFNRPGAYRRVELLRQRFL